MKETIKINGDISSPIDVEWDAECKENDMNDTYEINISHHYDELINDSGCYEALRKSEGFYLSEIAEHIEEAIEILKAREYFFIAKSGKFYYQLFLRFLDNLLAEIKLNPSHKIHIA